MFVFGQVNIVVVDCFVLFQFQFYFVVVDGCYLCYFVVFEFVFVVGYVDDVIFGDVVVFGVVDFYVVVFFGFLGNGLVVFFLE